MLFDELEVNAARRRTTIIVVVLGCFLGQSFARFTFGLVLPAMKADIGISYGLAGWLGTLSLAGYLISTVVTSAASLRIPPHRLIQLGIAMSTVGIVILGLAHTTAGLVVGMVLGGFGGAAAWIPAPMVAASVFPPERRGFAMGICSAAIGVGIILTTGLATLVRSMANDARVWRPIWLVEALVGVVATILALVVLAPVPVRSGSPPRLSVLRRVPAWRAVTGAYTCFGLGFALFSTYVVAALEHDAGFAKGHAVLVYALMGAGNTTGALTVGRLSDLFGRRVTMIGSFAAAGVGCVAVLIGGEPVVSLATFAYGFGLSGSIVSVAAYVGDHVRAQDFGAAFGMITAFPGVTQMIGPRLGGWMADRAGTFTAVFLLAALAWFCGAASAAVLPRRSQTSA